MAQPIGLIHPNTVNHLPAVLGHDMEQVVDHLSPWANHLRRIRKRLGVATTAQAIRVAGCVRIFV